MRKNIDFKKIVIWDYRKKIIIDKDNSILAFKASRDRYSQRQGKELAGEPYLGSNASEDALTWNVFRTLYETKRLGYLFKDYKLGRIKSLALWGLTPDTKYLNKKFQFDVGDTIRRYDGIFQGQTSEPDVMIWGSSGLCVIECKLGYPHKPLSHLWEGAIGSINKRMPVYSKVFPQFKNYQNKQSGTYYQLIRMAFYALILAKRYNIAPHLVSLTNISNWNKTFSKDKISPKDAWRDFCNSTGRILPELNLHSIFWQDIIKIQEIKKVGKLYRYLRHHPCLT